MKSIFYIFFLVSFSISAQVNGIIKDSISGKPIPYANIWIENENIGTTSEENGTFSLNASGSKNLVISALGYEKRVVNSNKYNIALLPKIFELNEIIIEKRKHTKEVAIGDFSKIKLNSGVTNTGQENVHVWSKFIRFNEKIKEHPFIKSIEFATRSQLDNVLLRIRIFNVDTEGIPIGDAVEDDILVPIQKGKKNNIVELAKYNISIPEEGILIGFEYLKLEQNKLEYLSTIQGEKGKHEMVSYEPSILGFYPGGETLLLLNRDGTLRRSTPINYGNVEIALKITLTN